MALIASDGLIVQVGNGADPELFHTLRGVQLTRLDVAQQLAENPAIRHAAWRVEAAVTAQQLVVEVEMLATDETAAIRVRSLAFSGQLGKFKLKLRSAETLQFSAFVSNYSETLQSGEVKRAQVRLTSSGAVTLG